MFNSLTQFSTSGSEACDVIIGFDFGTSCTKVVLRTPNHYGGRAFVVAFGGSAHRASPHLLPSVVHLTANDVVSLASGNQSKLLRDIKYRLMRNEMIPVTDGRGGDGVYDPKAVTVAFIATALRAARGWFLREQSALYGKFALRWSLNLGLPSADFADAKLKDDYVRIAKAAWWLSATSASVSVVDAAAALSAPNKLGELNDLDFAEVAAIPEVAAEVAGYARSSLRDEGLHLLVDIGASTLDVCGFILHKHNDTLDDAYELLTADVQLLGTMTLYEGRVKGVKAAVEAHVHELWDACDPVGPIPDDTKVYLPRLEEVALSVNQSSDAYRALCKRALWKTIVCLKKSRDPNSARWRDELPVFVTGGASVMELYQDLIREVSASMPQYYPESQGMRARRLPRPDNLVGKIHDSDYHRFAVAWGLSYPELDIGVITPPGDNDDVSAPDVTDSQREEVTKEMV